MKLFLFKIEQIIDKGFNNIEIPWMDDSNWLDLMSSLRSKFPEINLGSASNLNKKSIDDALKLNLDFSMMRFWERNLFKYSILNNHLLIPGISRLNDFQEAISLNCNIVKIYPINKKENSLRIENFNKSITFIAAGGLSIGDLNNYKSLGFTSIVIGEKGFNGETFDPNLLKWNNKI